MANIDAINAQVLSGIDESLGIYVSRLLMNADDLGHIGKQLEGITLARNLDGNLVERTYFLRSCSYKLAEEGLILTSLIISCIAHIGKTHSPDTIRKLNALADAIHETFDPQLHKILSENAPYRHHK